MKLLIIPDIHGRTESVDAAEKEISNYDQIIFLGDYVDSYERKDSEILYCLNNVIRIKKENPDKVILLLGNHELHYLFDDVGFFTGYRSNLKQIIQHTLISNLDLFQVAYSYKNYLFTHAGVGKLWLTYVIKNLSETELFKNTPHKTAEDVCSLLNILFETRYFELLTQIGIGSGGFEPQGGPFWLRPEEFVRHNIPANIHQVVGHTHKNNFKTYNQFRYTQPLEDRSITCIDVLETQFDKFYKLEL